tara:strand:- start:664 stop:957 length:294 start_codon:yes stop_codon:yes gene_type:complete
MANQTKMVDGKIVTLTDKEQKELDAIKKEWIDGKADRDLAELRMKRNRLLAETDWWASSDLTMTDAQKKYRQDLRDITKTYQSLSDKNFKFPTKPKE